MVEVKEPVEVAIVEGEDGLTPGELKAYRTRYTKLLNSAFGTIPARHSTGTVHRDAYNLLCRLRGQRGVAGQPG